LKFILKIFTLHMFLIVSPKLFPLAAANVISLTT